MSSTTFSGRTRRRQTTWSVRAADRLARGLIATAGIGTVVAVGLVFVFLFAVVIPLFRGSRLTPASAAPSAGADRLVHLEVDEAGRLAWGLRPDGTVVVLRTDDGAVLSTHDLLDGVVPTATSLRGAEGAAAFGFADGTLRRGRVRFLARYLDPEEATAELLRLSTGATLVHDGALVERTRDGQLQAVGLAAHVGEPLALDPPSPVVLVDESARASGVVLATLTADGTLRLSSVAPRKNLLTGRITATLSGGSAVVDQVAAWGAARHLFLTGTADSVLLLWEDGRLVRLDTRDIEAPAPAEILDLLPDPEARVTSAAWLIGKTTLCVGDSSGGLTAWFATKPRDATTRDGALLVAGHRLPADGTPITALGASARGRMLAAGTADGRARLYHVTTGRLLVERAATRDGSAVTAIAIAPKEDHLVVLSRSGMARLDVDAPHPEVSLAALLRPVWYEGHERPSHAWQAVGGSDDFEPKLGLWPLVFGSLKATTYSLLFGAPLALLAALFSSEFLHRDARSRIKPTVELMASLPSVVLGFLAALVFAPFVEGCVTEALAAFFTVPFTLLLAAQLWRVLPPRVTLRRQGWRFALCFTVALLGVALAVPAGGMAERVLFGGDIRAWLDGGAGGALGGFVLVLLPLAAVVSAWLMGRVVAPRLRAADTGRSRTAAAVSDLARFLVASVLAVSLATAGGLALQAVGLDPRGGVLDTYVQRNALVVGFVMGFAIIPIIYTIADDALTSVPDHLRSASLGAGATPWQTALHVVIPTAMSGMFSALMIGLGRAVGETMIVLMAAGNTPVLEWNLFNGFRTLSANIAVELPEAVQGSTHFRTLFLAALVLFGMTFALNTAAEMVRLRFRKRAYEL
jgi:phosphate transport system permease protein